MITPLKMAASIRLLRTAVFLLLYNRCLAWDNDEFELFDLVEEVNANFYDVLGVGQDATSADIRKAYRKLTLQVHPDKNKAEDAEEKFRQLVAIYEVLKDESKRQMYNRILVDGLPDWRTPVFYYRRARKMGFVELFGLLALIVTIGQYLFAWAVYVERRLTLEDMIDSKRKKERRKKSKASEEAEELQEEMASLPKPSVLDLWPFRLPGFLCWCMHSVPVIINTIKEDIAEKRRQKLEEEEEKNIDVEIEKVVRKPKSRKIEVPEYSAEDLSRMATAEARSEQTTGKNEPAETGPCNKGEEWSEEELALLAKAVNKFPGGTPKRWEKIASMIGRTVDEVCLKSKNLKGTYTMSFSESLQGNVLANTNSKMAKKNQHISDDITTVDYVPATETTLADKPQQNSGEHIARRRNRATKPTKTAERTLLIPQTVPSKETHTNGVKEEKTEDRSSSQGKIELVEEGKDGEAWSQNQQVIFEWALRQYPKGTDKRWDKIADQIPGKTKEDCIIRFKYLADLVKKKREDNQTS